MRTLLRRMATLLGFAPPPLYAWPGMDVSLADHRRLHMVGSIHMGTKDMAPLPARLLFLLRQATALVVEADITIGSPLANIPPVDTPLSARLSPGHYGILSGLCKEYDLDEEAMSTLPAWRVALMLQARQAERLGLRAAYGIDYQLIQAARDMDKPVIELEGPEEQLDLLLQLPDQGAALLQDTLRHWHTNARLLQTMIGWWLNSRPVNLAKAFPSTFSADLYHYLMTERNLRWKQRLEDLPAGGYVVAVGALHLYGAESLPSLLQR
ncbi:TraB/GumN family protein [Acerihabitans arboris]|uniref:Conjugal transfer protein TraB n=1 Tax=Acerihabitans arboris TaxID=2691583 RepID=A0A845SQ54_9GAMM|nr:TraB/GumN family protein [Acerihabitans arboris]NDL65046.1 conjugal transfer protein TraB [Acerihabitans arboris]